MVVVFLESCGTRNATSALPKMPCRGFSLVYALIGLHVCVRFLEIPIGTYCHLVGDLGIAAIIYGHTDSSLIH